MMLLDYWGGNVYGWMLRVDSTPKEPEVTLRVPPKITCHRCGLNGTDYFTYCRERDCWVCPRCSATMSNFAVYAETMIREREENE